MRDEEKLKALKKIAFSGSNHGFPRKPEGPPPPETFSPDGEEHTVRAACSIGDWFAPREMRETLAKLDAARELCVLLEHDYDLLAEAVNQNSGECDPGCDSHGHTDTCKYVSNAETMRLQQDKIDNLRQWLHHYACRTQELSWHGEAMECAVCKATWNNGIKRGEPATPEIHRPWCLLFGYKQEGE